MVIMMIPWTSYILFDYKVKLDNIKNVTISKGLNDGQKEVKIFREFAWTLTYNFSAGIELLMQSQYFLHKSILVQSQQG